MKKSFSVNLGGRIFQIDDDAYEQLNDYLVSIKTCFKDNECGEEISSDIEARMGELFEERMTTSTLQIITLPLVNEMIARMGKPESIMDDTVTDDDEQNSSENSDKNKKNNATAEEYLRGMSMGKKLFRDGDNKLLGGVVSGLAAYFNINLVLLRVIAILLMFVSTFWAFLLYLIMWAVVPLAVTTTEKLRMQGVEPTPENIAEKLAYEEPAIDKIVRNIKEVDNNGISTLLIILGCVLFISAFAVPALSSAFCSINGVFRILPFSLVFCWIGTISLIAIPVIAIVLVLSKQWSALSTSVKWLLFIDWILSFVQIYSIMSTNIPHFNIIYLPHF